MTQPSSGGPRYTMDTSVFPYTADTEGYKRLSGRPVNNFDKNILIFFSRLSFEATLYPTFFFLLLSSSSLVLFTKLMLF